MKKFVLAALLCLIGLGVQAQTYFGVLTTPANSGPGGSCCSDVKMVYATGAAVPSDCVGCSIITQADYQKYQSGAAAVHPKNVQAILLAGLAVTFSSTTSANATYAADPATIASYQTQINNFLMSGTFIGASALIQVADVNGNKHGMNSNAFKALHAALQTYANAVNTAQANAIANNTPPSWPPATANVTG